MAKKPISNSEAKIQIASALNNEFYVPTSRSIEIFESRGGLTRVVFSAKSHSRDLRERLRPHFGKDDQFEIRALGGPRFEVRARSLRAIVNAIKKTFSAKGGKK